MSDNILKSFSSIYLNDWKILVEAVVGLEFEFYSKKSYAKLLELLNIELAPVQTWGFNTYHSDFKTDSKRFKIEPDYSGGPDMVELITGPLEYNEALVYLIKILNFIKKWGWTDEKCSIHINISFKDKDVKKVNKIALILDIDETYIYNHFPTRKGNIYAKSVKNIIPYKYWDTPESAINLLENSVTLPDETKYYGINISNIERGWIEYRYLGGVNYEQKQSSILETLDYLILLSYNSISIPLNNEHIIKLRAYMGERINKYNKFKSYLSLKSNFPNIEVQIDMKTDPSIVESYYLKLYKKIYEYIANSSYGNVIVNYNTTTNRIEIVNTRLIGGNLLEDIDIINCTLEDSRLYNVNIFNSKIFKSHINECLISNTEVISSRIDSCNVLDYSIIKECYTLNSNIDDATIDGGVFKPGSISKNTQITPDTLLPKSDNFWGKDTAEIKKIKK